RDCVAVAERREDALVRSRGEKLIQEVLDPTLRQTDAEVVRGDVFERVCLVENDGLILRKNPAAVPTDREVREKHRVIDDEDARSEYLLPSLEVKTVRVVRALATQTVAAVALHEIPHRFVRLHGQVRLAPVLRLARPAPDLNELIDRARRVEQRACLRLCR